MNEKRFMVTAERVDGKGKVQGYYVGDKNHSFKEHCIMNYGFVYEINPKTIESVAVKVVLIECEKILKNGSKNYFQCPSCTNPVGFEFEDNYFTKFCSLCGQRLDWD